MAVESWQTLSHPQRKKAPGSLPAGMTRTWNYPMKMKRALQRHRRREQYDLPPSGLMEKVMTNSVPKFIAAAELPERGQPLAGGVFVTRYWLNGQERALVLLDAEYEGSWGEYGAEIEGADSYSDGEANTRAMAEAGSEIAIKALELEAFIPSCLEGQLVMAAKADGLVTLREDRFHWMSTQFSADHAYGMAFEDGWLNYLGKDGERLVRPVRSLPIQ